MPVAEPGLQRLRMTWEDYLALPEKPKAEWVDGEVVVSPPVGADHGEAAAELVFLFRTHLPGLRVMTEVGLSLPHNRLRAPDVMVVEQRPTATWVTEPPVLVVEVLSPSTRREDTIRKTGEYAAGGVGQYWIVDPERRCLDVYANDSGTWVDLLHLDDEAPSGEVVVGRHGVVPVELLGVFPD